jgi:hypothetical protein
MEQPTIADLNHLVEGVLYANKRDATGAERFDQSYLDHDGIVKASIAQPGNNRRKTSWIAEVGVLVDRTPFEVTEVVFRTSTDDGDTWSKPRDGASESLREQGALLREHVIGLRDSGRFATHDQGLAAIASLKALFAAVRSNDADELAVGMKRAQALLCQITADVPPPPPPAARRGRPRIEDGAAQKAEKRFNIAGLMAKVNESRADRGEAPVPRKDWPADRRTAQPYIDEVRSAAAAPVPK